MPKKILLIDNYRRTPEQPKKSSQIEQLIRSLKKYAPSDVRVDVKPVYEVRNEMVLGADISKDYALAVSSGSNTLRDYDTTIHRYLSKAMQNRHVLGICHGHQALAKAYGAEVVKSAKHNRGHRATKVSGHGMFAEIPSEKKGRGNYIGVNANHGYHIPVRSAGSLEVLAESEVGEEGKVEKIVDAFKVPGRKHYGVQFHPEREHKKSPGADKVLKYVIDNAYKAA